MTVAETRLGADGNGAHQPSVDDVSGGLGMGSKHGRPFRHGVSSELHHSTVPGTQKRVWHCAKLVALLSTREATRSG